MKLPRLQAMLTNAMSFDTETERSQPGIAAPLLCCASVARWNPATGRPVGHLLDYTQALDVWLAAIADERITLVMANAVFDMLVMAVEAARARKLDVMPLIFAAYEAGRVFDVSIAEALHHIALGCLGIDPMTRQETFYSLDDVHRMVTGKSNAKANDRWRQSYGLLRPYPIAQWPTIAGPEAVDYPVDDSCNTLEDGLAQAGLIGNVGQHRFDGDTCTRCHLKLVAGISPMCTSVYPRSNLHDLANQAYTHWCMQLGAAWGLTPDPVAVANLKFKVTKNFAVDVLPFIEAGIIELDSAGEAHERQAPLKKLVALAYGAEGECPRCATTMETVGEGRGKARVTRQVRAPGRIPNITPKGVHNTIACPECDGTGLNLNRDVPRTDKGGIQKGRDQLYQSGNAQLEAYATFGADRKIRTTYIPFLEQGIAPELQLRDDEMTPEGLASCLRRIEMADGKGITPITLSPNVLLETNRTSYRDKTQTLPRQGGVRQCFRARRGMVYYSNDYGTIELRTWAQICIWMVGFSDLAIALNAGDDVHSMLAAEMSGTSYLEFLKRVEAGEKDAKYLRQAAKPGNFMFPGGGGVATFVEIQREQGPFTPHESGSIVIEINGKMVRGYPGLRFCLLMSGAQRCGEVMVREWNKKECVPLCKKCLECAQWIKEGWSKKWREARPYFDKITQISKGGFQKHPISNRVRGGIGFCDGANGYFQELAAQGAKDALRHVVREQYDRTYRFDESTDLDGESILLDRSRNIAFLHDELLGEAFEVVAPECAERVCTIMNKRMKIYVPDVVITSEPTLMPAWYKEAACVRDANGRLQVWRPKQ